MKKQIVRISVLQSSKVAALLYSLIGFVYSFIGAMLLISGTKDRLVAYAFLVGPLWTALFGFIFFAIASALYNVAVRWIGGFEFEVEDVDDKDDSNDSVTP
jgi:hypothetical protein